MQKQFPIATLVLRHYALLPTVSVVYLKYHSSTSEDREKYGVKYFIYSKNTLYGRYALIK